MPKRTTIPKVTVRHPLRAIFLIAIIYIGLIFILPANKIAMQNYHLTATQYHILLFSVLLPLIMIWFAAFYSWGTLQRYAIAIAKTPEGRDFTLLARGSGWLAWGLVIPSLVSIILNTIANAEPSFLKFSLITTNYLSLIIPLVGFNLMRRASGGLTEHAKIRLSSANMQVVISMFVVLGVVFCYFIFRKLDLNSINSSENPYHLPGWLLISTIIVPYLYAWFSGLLAAYEIMLFSRQVSGVFYRQAMRLISGGMVAVITSFVGLQCLRSITPRVGHLSLSTTLVGINLIYVCMAAGFILISIGAAKLKKIEEV